jgi:hypothetical protein
MIINRYKPTRPLPEKIYKELEYIIRYVFLWFVNGFRVKTMLFYPDLPSKRAVIVKLAKKLRFNLTNNPRCIHNLVMNWENTTYRTSFTVLENISKKEKVLNLNCTDISKEKVDELSVEIFGYGTFINPTTFNGKCVQKSNINAKHDGRVINCPVEKAEEGYIYQKVLDNKVDENFVRDIRVPLINGVIPFVYLKYRPVSDRFSNTNSHASLEKKENYLSEDEQAKIITFAEKVGLDYGELDVLRDNEDKKIYIVDVNNTPWGPPNHLPESDRQEALEKLAGLFEKEFIL